MSSLTITKYCDNPSEYGSGLSEKTKIYYDNICLLRKGIAGDWKKRLKTIGKGTEVIAETFGNMFLSIFSPQGLEMLSIFMGINLAGKLAMNAMLRVIASGVGPEVMAMASEQAIKSGGYFVSNSILSTVLSNAVEEGTAAAKALEALEVTADAVDIFMIILTIVQFLGAIMDTWDPEGYNNQMNADALNHINSKFNEQFMISFLNHVTQSNDEFGRPILYATWPVEFYADSLIATSKKKKYEVKKYKYVSDYLLYLKVNSDGEPIVWPSGTDIISLSHFQKFAREYSLVVADKNTVVANWVNKYWVLLLGILLIILIILILIK